MRIIGGHLRSRALQTPRGLDVRPTAGATRKCLFDILQPYIDSSTVLDIFAGSGALGFEALSRGAKSLTAIENNRAALQCIRANAQSLGLESQTSVLSGDAFKILKKLIAQKMRYDIIFADPPYYETIKTQKGPISFAEHLLEIIDSSDLLADQGFFFLECDKRCPLEEIELRSLARGKVRTVGRAKLMQYQKKST